MRDVGLAGSSGVVEEVAVEIVDAGDDAAAAVAAGVELIGSDADGERLAADVPDETSQGFGRWTEDMKDKKQSGVCRLVSF